MSGKTAPPAQQVMLDERAAVRAYLDSLLSEISPEAEVQIDAVLETKNQPATPAPAPHPDPQIPPWAEQSFQALLFDAIGITFAVPLIHLNGVENWPANLTSLPGKPEWYMGLHPYREHNAVVVDIQQIVIPEGRQNIDPDEVQRGYNNVVFVGEGEWGLACNGVAEVISLTSDEVSWRTVRGKRPWLAGTVREKMCAVLDIDQFIGMLRADQQG